MSIDPHRDEEVTAEVCDFPRQGFVIGDHHCRAPGPKAHLMCFAEHGHAGEHSWGDWRGCRLRTPHGVLPFGGFAS